MSDSPVTSHPVSVGDQAEDPEDCEGRELADTHAERISQFRKSSLTPSQSLSDAPPATFLMPYA